MLDPKEYFTSSPEDKAYFATEVASATRTGVFSANFFNDTCYMDELGRAALGIPTDFPIRISESARFFADVEVAGKLLHQCTSGQPIETDVLARTYDDRKIWMRLTCKTKKNQEGDVIGVRGVFTSIDRYLRSKQEAEKHCEVIEAQNERLIHFAHIVSHNLRSHSSNLELTLELFKDIAEDDPIKVFYSYLDEISLNLSTTLHHLNEVVTINLAKNNLEVVNIKSVINTVTDKHRAIIDQHNITVKTDLFQLQYIEYVNTFMLKLIEVLFLNAVSHKDPNKNLVIQVRTKIKKNKRLLIFKDNGIGLDLENDLQSVFNLKTGKEERQDDLQLGLFLIKNQIESLGGDIIVKSKPGKGTRFNIKF
jgi:signal transduction histidine kinase